MTSHEDERFDGVLVVRGSDLGPTRAKGEGSERRVTLEGLWASLLRALAPDLVVAEPIVVRVALASVAASAVRDDARLALMARRGGQAWLRLVDAMYDATLALIGREEALAVVSRGEDSLALRARILARLTRSLEETLSARGLVDPRRTAERAAHFVARADARVIQDSLGARYVRARGITRWTLTDLAAFRVLDASLSRVGGGASIELPVFERPLDAARERDPLDALIEAVASALDDAPHTGPVAATLGDLRMRRGDRPPPETRVEVRRADGKEAQGRAVADAVYAALEDGASPSGVVVGLVSENEDSAVQILRALGELGIPASDERRTRAPRSNLLALAEAALDVAARGSERRDVARLLRSPYVDARTVMDDRDADAAARALKALARCLEETPTVRGDGASEHLAATVLASHVTGTDTRRALATRAARLGVPLRQVTTPASRDVHVRRSRALYRDLGLGPMPPTATIATESLAALNLAAEARDAVAWERLEGMLVAYEGATARLGLQGDEVTLETFRHELAWGLAQPLPAREDDRDAVRLVSFSELPTTPTSLVVVADADSDSWPEGQALSGLIPAALEDRLLRAGDPTERPIATLGSAPVLAHLSLATSRARHVVFAYPTHDDEGGLLAPAPIVAWLQCSVPVSSYRPTTSLARPRSDRERRLSELARRPSRAAALSPDVARRALLERSREDTFGFSLTPQHPLVATLPRGPLFAPILIDETGGGARPLPASGVDRLASCVFQGFVAEVLRPKRRGEAHDIADAREEGNLTHAGLEAAFRATAPLWNGRPRDRDAILRTGLAAADAVFARSASSELARTVALRLRDSVRAVLEWSIADEEWDFAHAEQSFGEGEGWPALVLEQGGVRLSLRGRIDRVDVAHRGEGRTSLRVIDYKTRASAAESSTARFGTTTFQLALYGQVAVEAKERGAAFGVYLGTQRLRPGTFPKKHIERWNDAHTREGGVFRFERAVLGRVAELREGHVEVRPYDESSCERCEYDGVCRKPRFAPSMPDDDDEAPSEEDS